MTEIKVVDAICGSGKTTWIFQHMKEHPDRKWLFVGIVRYFWRKYDF